MNINEKALKAVARFEVKKRTDETEFVVLKDTEGELYEAVRNAHGDRFPDDFIYSTFLSLLERIGDYEIDDDDKLQEYRYEIVESLVDVYTHDLTAWLHKRNDNVFYLSQAIADGEQDGFKALSQAQYIAIDEVMNSVCDYLTSDSE